MATIHVWVNKTNEEKLRAEPSMSGLINVLLEKYYERKSNPLPAKLPDSSILSQTPGVDLVNEIVKGAD